MPDETDTQPAYGAQVVRDSLRKRVAEQEANLMSQSPDYARVMDVVNRHIRSIAGMR